MALSPSSGFIKPEVWAAAVQASVQGQLVLARFATTFDQLSGVPGDTLSLVEFSRLTELSTDTDESTTLVPEVMTSTDTSLTIVEASKAAEISWRAARVAFGDPVGSAANETARVIAARVDTKLKAAAEAAAASRTTTKAANISYAAVIEATAPFGDAVANGGVSLVIHSKQFRDLLTSEAEFKRSLDNGGAGFVGYLADTYPVYVSDRITVTDATTDTYTALLFFGSPLAYAYKNELETHQQDDILKRSTLVTSTIYYAVGTMRPERVAALVTQ